MSAPLPSPALRLAQIFFAVLFCLLCGGVIFGFAALKPVLIQQGVYADLCLPGERQSTVDGIWLACKDQDTRLNLAFTLASVVTNAVFLPIGYTMDKMGPRVTCIAGAIFFALGNFIFGLGYRSSWFDSYIIGFVFLGIGGPLIYLPQFHLSNTFPAYSGAILAAISGAFDASAIPYVVYRAAYDASGGTFTIRTFFWGYMAVALVILVEQIFIAPAATYMRLIPTDIEEFLEPAAADEAAVDPIVAAAGSSFSRVADDLHAKKEHSNPDTMTGILYGKSATEQLKSHWFILLMIFVCVQMTRINFYLMTVDTQLERFTGDRALAQTLTTAFTILLPVGGIVGIPFIGALLDNRPLFDVFGVLTAMGIGFGVLGLTTAAWSQILGILIFCLFRPLMYTANSDSFAKIFGFETFGTVFGLAMTISGLCSLFNAPFDQLVKNQLHGSFMELDVALLLVGALGCAGLMVAMWKQSRTGVIRIE